MTDIDINTTPLNERELGRILHRVVRAMHDGHCPHCGHIGPSETFAQKTDGRLDHTCPRCAFFLTHEDASEALRVFAPVMRENLEVFLDWKQQRNEQMLSSSIDTNMINIHDQKDSIQFVQTNLQNLIDGIFQIAQQDFGQGDPDYESRSRDKHMEWVARQLELLGIQTKPVGASWGIITGFKEL